MKALITGASSGLGKDFAIKLSEMGYDLVLVSRDKKNLEEVKKMCKTNAEALCYDLTNRDNVYKVFDKNKDIDLLINNAGFGLFGKFDETNLDKELDMIDLNVTAVHILTKLYYKEMVKKDSGRILNIASIAAFLPGPLMNTYYASKVYVFRLTLALHEELRHLKSNVKVSVLCPGPFISNFNNVANVRFELPSLTSDYVANYALNKMFKNKLIIIPGFKNKVAYYGLKLLPIKMQLKMDYDMQKRKDE